MIIQWFMRGLCCLLGHSPRRITAHHDDSTGRRHTLASKTYCGRCLEDIDEGEAEP